MQLAAAPQLTHVLSSLRHTFAVADATLPDMPLVYASEGCDPSILVRYMITCLCAHIPPLLKRNNATVGIADSMP